jgi:hypothetical protein
MSISRYKSISKLDTNFDSIKKVTHIPSPTKDDYVVGYIDRHFIQKANDINSPIYEINKSSRLNFVSNSFYVVTSMKWRLRGTSSEIKKSNTATIRIASVDIPKIGLYLPNLLQFHKK